jgi:6-phosphogluconolactonase
MQPRLHIYPNQSELVNAAAEMIVSTIAEATRARGLCALALSGGNTPRAVYEKLAQENFRGRIDWQRVHWFWGDERMVPPEHEESNYRMTREALLAHVPAPEGSVHRIKGELSPQDAAHDYREVLEAFFKPKEERFDLVLLGLGEDGHTASLFPATTALHETAHDVTEVFVPKFDKWRVTLTLPIINRGRKAAFLTAGKAKAEIVAGVLSLPQPDLKWPASLIQPQSGELVWLLDNEAAKKLHGEA